MATVESTAERRDGNWIMAVPLQELREKGAVVIKAERKQIVLFHSDKGVYACNNRCPHEGYPLKEGTLTGGCVLTCNWHNWKFDLESGETLVGGDRLRRYPVDLRAGEVWIDIGDPPAKDRIETALCALHDSFRRMEYDRMAREIARLKAAGGDPLEAIRRSIRWTHAHFEFGTTHAIAAAPDWLDLSRDYARDEFETMAPVVEVVAHLAWDSLREPLYAFPEGTSDYSPDALVRAIENEDEAAAVRMARGALKSGLDFADLARPLAQAALAHYADFGHSAIYVVKTQSLIDRLGPTVAEPLLLALVRSLVYAWREDLIPEFRTYGPALWEWQNEADNSPRIGPRSEDFRGLSAKQAMALCLEYKGEPEALYQALLGASAWNLLHFDRRVEQRFDNNVADNVGWLSFTHAITFANAGRILAERYPNLWPQTLLQMACFVGRNNAYVDEDQDLSEWRVDNRDGFLANAAHEIFDHGQFEYIVACHLVKTLTAAGQELKAAPDAPWADDLTAAVNRFLHTPIKRKHVIRTMRQSRHFVALEG
jgi:nitrite reductase/ring-hydroxylating ferredoxin subunit